jgi:hypothetical protein
VPARRPFAQLLVDSDDVHRRTEDSVIAIGAGAVRDGKAAAIGNGGAALEGEFVAQRLQQRDHPRLARCRRQRLAIFGAGAAPLERLPIGAHIAPHRGDLVDQRAAVVQPKVGRLLPRLVVDAFEKIG